MNYRASRQALRVFGILMVVFFPVMLAVWFAHMRAVSDTRDYLNSFAVQALKRTDNVEQYIDKARIQAEKYEGPACSPAHREVMLNIVRGRLYIEDMIYTRGDAFLCSTTLAESYRIAPANYYPQSDTALYYFRDTPFYAGHKMLYLRKGDYVAVVNPLSYGEAITDDPSLTYGIYDTASRQFFSLSENTTARQLLPLTHTSQQTFQRDGRFYTIVHAESGPVAVIISVASSRFYQAWHQQLAVTLPTGVICSALILLLCSRTRRQINSPRRLLQRALQKKQLRLHYQPIVDTKQGRCVGAEALLRWPGYNGPVMHPAEFIPLAEKEGMIARVTDYVVAELYSDLGEYLARNPELYISLNLSASDFHSSRLIALIEEKNKQYGVRARQIKIEVTERGFIDVAKTTPVIQAFRQAGFEVAIDDFGTGYSNLHNLYSLNVDILKIDKSFIDTLIISGASHLIVEHIIEMAHSLRLKIIAEGVETADQVSWLQGRGVQYCQGWYFSRALPSREFILWRQQQRSTLVQPFAASGIAHQAL